MKKIFSISLMAVLAASSAQAEVFQIEPRVFHSNLHLNAGATEVYENGVSQGRTKADQDSLNGAGLGISGIFALSEQIDLGLGYSMARYFPSPEINNEQQVLEVFSRLYMAKTTSSKLYFLAGASSHQFSIDIDSKDDSPFSQSSSFTPIVNYDLGIGGALNFGIVDLGLEYKYSNTLANGSATFVSRASFRNVTEEYKSKTKDIALESQEISLTVGVSL